MALLFNRQLINLMTDKSGSLLKLMPKKYFSLSVLELTLSMCSPSFGMTWEYATDFYCPSSHRQRRENAYKLTIINDVKLITIDHGWQVGSATR